MRIRVIYAALAVVVLMASAVPADAQGQSDEWEFQIAPLYLWAVSVDGTMTLKGRFD